MAAATPTDGSVNANDIGAVAMTTDRKLHVSVQDALPAGTNAIGKLAANSGVDIGDTDVTSVVPGTGATNLGKAEDAQHTTGDVGVMILGVRNDSNAQLSRTDLDYTPISLDSQGRQQVAGPVTDDNTMTVGGDRIFPAGFLVDESSTDSADEGDGGFARMTANRQQIVTVRPNANGEGLDIFRSLDIDETEEDVKTSAGKVYGWYMFNAAASTRYVKFYNATAANVTVGSTTPVMTIPIPTGSGANVEFTNGIPFSTAISVAATTGVADADTRAPSANDVIINILYK